MKQVLTPLSILLAILFSFNSAKASKYYFSNNSGNDTRSSTQAQNSTTPWKTLSKLNSFFSSLKPGDSLLFKSGEIFFGSITATKSGSVALPIVLSSYGTGSMPIISGFQTLTNWVSIGNGIYESYNSSLATSVNMVTLNGAIQPIGRYPNIDAPNKGYLTFESHGNNSITDNQLSSSINWVGAELVVRSKRWILDRRKITSHSGATLSYSSALTYSPYDNYGYFVQNHIKTLDQIGEWYYNPATKKMDVYFGFNKPSSYTIQASSVNSLVTVSHQDNIVFNGLCFIGSNTKAFDLYYAQNIRLQNCTIKFSGIDGIDASATNNLMVLNTYVNSTNNNAVDLNYNCVNSIIRLNYIANTGMIPGMGLSGNGTYQAVTITGRNNLAEYNTIVNTGCIAIRFGSGDSNIIKNNFINYFTMTKDDGGGIYSFAAKNSSYSNQKIIGNIILNGIGVPEGTDKPGTGSSTGIYLDNDVSNMQISSNTVANCFKSGIFIHNSFLISVLDNVLYNNTTQLIMVHDTSSSTLLRNNIIKNNTFFSKGDSQIVSSVSTMANDIGQIGAMENNYFCRPIDDNLTITSSSVINGVRVDKYHDLANWTATYKFDKTSQKSPIQIPEYVINSLGPNMYSNGSFNTSITGLYSNPLSSWVSNKLDGGSYQATNLFTTLSNYQVIIGVGALSSKKNYILKFSSKASRDTLLNTYLRISGSPYTTLSDIKVVPISTSRKENEYLFSLPATSSAASIIFSTKCPGLTFWIDNLELRDANVSITDPDDYIIFEYNATQSNKTILLPAGATYVDVNKNTYTNSIVIPPYSSVALIKQTPGSMPVTFNNIEKKISLLKSNFYSKL